MKKMIWGFASFLLLALLLPSPWQLAAQQAPGGLRGQVTDPSAAAVPGAKVTVSGPQGLLKVVTTDREGRYTLADLPPGQYSLQVSASGFAPWEQSGVSVAAGQAAAIDVRLSLNVEKQQVTVSSESSQVDVSPEQNVGAIVLNGEDLEALPDNPEDLQADLEALAGPAAGPNGGQIYVDGFSGASLPPKSSIREIRINQNPFSAEYDRLGFGRIEIFTKPGTDQFHGQVFFNLGDSVFDARNPFAPSKPSFQSRMYDGNVSGPLSKKASFFLDAQRRSTDESAVVNAVTIDPSSLALTPFSANAPAPSVMTHLSPRLDYQLTPRNTLTARYSFVKNDRTGQGVGQFSLPSHAYNTTSVDHMVQLTETATLNATTINETRFQYIHDRTDESAVSSAPSLVVLDAFTGGGSGVGQSHTNTNRIELQNMTSLTRGPHTLRIGGRLREVLLSNQSMQNFNGTFTFSSLNAYRVTLAGLQSGLTPEQIRAAGGLPSQFSLTAGDPRASLSQFDIGLFAQDDWRLRRNFTLSLGLRYETQDHIDDRRDVAPRVGFAWGLGRGTKPPKTVLRGGFGLFYDRVTEDLTMQTIQLNGVREQQYLIPFPSFYPNVPLAASLAGTMTPLTIREFSGSLRAPYVAQTAVSLERQLPKNVTLSVTYASSRGIHMLRSRNINAPLPGSNSLFDPASVEYPFPGEGNLYIYESSGFFRQNQLITNVNARVNPNFMLFGFYALGKASSDTDGAGSFPANQYDLSGEYSRAGFDVRHRAVIGGSVTGPFGFQFSPFIFASSGRPFNITVGRDLNGDSLFNDRPAFATDLTRPSVLITPLGAFDMSPMPGQIIIPRNYGEGPGQFSLNMRLSRTFGFGGERSSSANARPGGFGGGGRGGGPRGGAPGGAFGGGMAGMHGIFTQGGSPHRYSLTFSIAARNLLNNVNLAPPVGTLTSPLFGKSNALAGGGGPFSGATTNRRIDMQLRFTF